LHCRFIFPGKTAVTLFSQKHCDVVFGLSSAVLPKAAGKRPNSAKNSFSCVYHVMMLFVGGMKKSPKLHIKQKKKLYILTNVEIFAIICPSGFSSGPNL
jgi:hypothetical protein